MVAVARKEDGEVVNGEEEKFEPGRPPPFRIGDVRAAIPSHCWVKNPWRSMSYVLRDVVVIALLALAAGYLDSWTVWPIYWLTQGTMFWAVFVLGHDCGHGSFSNSVWLNNVVGHFLHSSILVPYHGWRISHRTHHQNHGNVDKDESWHPKNKNCFFVAANQEETLLLCLSWMCGPTPVFKLYGVPYLVFVMWLDLVTYSHHHGYYERVPWYRGREWSYLRGGLTTIDRDYGWINNIHHDIGTHVIHHLFPQIPHYNLVEATKAAKPVLGKYYREPEKSGPLLPLHLFGILLRSLRVDHFVSDEGDVVYYQTDPPQLYGRGCQHKSECEGRPQVPSASASTDK